MSDMTLAQAVADRGAHAVWDLMTEDERLEAASALWREADRETRAVIELTLAKEMKFRPQSVRRLPAAKIAGRLERIALTLPETVLFQLLFHLHMAERRPLLVRFLDAVGLPHNDGALDLEEDTPVPAQEKVTEAAKALVEAEGHSALVYLATLKVADADFWTGVDPVLEAAPADG